MPTNDGHTPYYSPEELRQEFVKFVEQQEKIDGVVTKRQFASHLLLHRGYFWDLENKVKGDYSDTLQRISRVCESRQEKALFKGKNVVGAIFALKNNYPKNWKDKKEVEYINENKDRKALSIEELEKRIAQAKSLENNTPEEDKL